MSEQQTQPEPKVKKRSKLAPLWDVKKHLLLHRFVAFTFDMAICIQLSSIIFIIGFPYLNRHFSFPENFFFHFHIVFMLYFIWAYYVVTEATKLNASLGKRILGLRIVKAQGGTLTMLQSTIHTVLAPVSLAALALGFTMAAYNTYHLAWHDIRARVRVVLKENENLLPQPPEGTTV